MRAHHAVEAQVGHGEPALMEEAAGPFGEIQFVGLASLPLDQRIGGHEHGLAEDDVVVRRMGVEIAACGAGLQVADPPLFLQREGVVGVGRRMLGPTAEEIGERQQEGLGGQVGRGLVANVVVATAGDHRRRRDDHPDPGPE